MTHRNRFSEASIPTLRHSVALAGSNMSNVETSTIAIAVGIGIGVGVAIGVGVGVAVHGGSCIQACQQR